MKSILNVGLIEEYLKENNLTKTAFCKQCHISSSSYEKIMKGQYDDSIIALYKIARQIDSHICEMFI